METEHTDQCVKSRMLHDRLESAYSLMWRDYCTTCNGLGGSIYYYDPSPAGISLGAGWMEDFEPCPDCTEQGICPRCGTEYDDHDFLDERMVCPTCGWNCERADHDSRLIVLTDDNIADQCLNVDAMHAIPPKPECYCYELMADLYGDTYEEYGYLYEPEHGG